MFVHEKPVLEALLRGSTHHLELGEGVTAAVFYGAGGEALMRAPDGGRRVGDWQVTASGYHVDWNGGASADWQIDLVPGRIAYCDGTGAEKARVTRIVPGNDIG